MLKVGDAIAPCEKELTNNKVSMVAVKLRNGYSNIVESELQSSDQNTSSTDSKGLNDTDNEIGDIRNGSETDREVYEYCRQIINSPSTRAAIDNVSEAETTTSNTNLTNEIPQELKNDSNCITNSDSRKKGRVIKRKKVKDQPSVFAKDENNCANNLQTEMETCTDRTLDTDSSSEPTEAPLNFSSNNKSMANTDPIMPINKSDNGEVENKIAEEAPAITVTIQPDVEVKNTRGQKAKKSLISNFNHDIGSQIQEKHSDGLKSASPAPKKDCDANANLDESISSSTLAGMTIKVNVLENALGLSTQSFSQLDAKTFDRIVLSVFQHKGHGQARKSGLGARASAKFGSTSRHANNRRVGSAFMSDHLQPSQSSVIQHQLQSINSTDSSVNSSDAYVKKPGFLAKKTSAPSSFSTSYMNVEASESMDSDNRSSPNSFAHDSSSKSSFIQKARKSSQAPWSSYKSRKDVVDIDSSTGVNSQSNVSEGTSFLDRSRESEGDGRSYMQTRQSFKRKCSWDSVDIEDTLNSEQCKEKKMKSEFLVPMCRARYSNEANNHHQSSLEANSENVSRNDSFDDRGEKVLGELTSHDPACLCCCLLPGLVVASNSSVTKCQAIDSFDGKALGCSRKVTNFELLRPSPGIPFKAFCDDHQKKLKDHQCCPGCGLFCTQGNFFECKEENRLVCRTSTDPTMTSSLGRSSSALHRFHKKCQVFSADNKCYCPHCYSESPQLEGVVYSNEPRPATLFPDSFRANHDHSDNGSSLKSQSARLSIMRRDSKNKNGGSICGDSMNSFQSSFSEETKMKSNLDLNSLLESHNHDNAKIKKGRPCSKGLCLASKAGDIKRVLYMLTEGVDPTSRPDDVTQPAMHLAAKYDHKDVVHILLTAGVSPDSIDHDLRTPLMEASQNGCLSIIDLLIKAGCSVDARAHDGMTALHLAAKSGKKEAVKVLLETRKIDINMQDDGGWTALIWASEHGHKDCISLLLSMGADPNLKDNELNTALHWATFTGSDDMVATFLDAGCFIDDVNDHGDTPLHIASRQNHFKCVEVLLWRWADTTITNKAGLTPLRCCVDEKCKSAQQLMFVKRIPTRPKEKIVTRDISRGRESCQILVVNSIDSENAPPDFFYILGYVETSPINVNRLVTSLQVCNCTDNCSSSSCSCCGSSVKRWYDENGRLSSDFNFLEPPLIFECNIMCACRATCLNRVAQLGTINNLQVFRTNGRGWGCRTLRDIAKGTFVCEYAGELISDEEANRREDDSYLFDLDFQDSETYCIDAARYGNVSRFINHLCEPNVIPVKVFVDHQDLRFPRICFFASKDIKAYDELGFDYGYKFWSIKWKYFTCTCGSQNCKYSKDTILKTIDEYNRSHAEEGDDD